MDVRATANPAPLRPAQPDPARRAADLKAVATDSRLPARPENDDKARATRPSQPPIATSRVQLMIDERLNRVFGRVVDQESGEEVRQIPSETVRRIYAQTLDLLGPLGGKAE